MQKSKPVKRRKSLFSPDDIVNNIHQNLVRDLSPATHVYADIQDPDRFGMKTQRDTFLSKYRTEDEDKPRLEQEAYGKFLNVNAHMANVNDKLSRDFAALPNRRYLQSKDPHWTKIHMRARAIVHFVLGQFNEDEWFRECRNSSGSSIGVPYSDTSTEAKFTYPLSTTARVKPMMERYLQHDYVLRDAMENLNHGRGQPRYSIHLGSRASTVDKTSSARRFIGVEPTCNMFLQQGLMLMMYKRMAKVGLNVETLPELHKELARIFSITREGATIDWASASDCSSTMLCHWLIPVGWYGALDLVRCKTITIDGTMDVEQHMISTMGNATTFPIETLVFWAYAHATIMTEKSLTNALLPEWDQLNIVSVFGDDCIVPTSYAKAFINTMTEVGFLINDDKSFYGDERFRESCGGDYLAGYDVRPYKVRAPQNNRRSSLEPWLYIQMNRLYLKYVQYFGRLNWVYDRHVFHEFQRLFVKHNLQLKIVPNDFPDDSGFKISDDMSRFLLCYPFKTTRIKRSNQGFYTFKYCRFSYKESKMWHEGLRYAIWLKKPVQCPRPVILHEYKTRKIGGYVEAKGVTSRWFVPNIVG